VEGIRVDLVMQGCGREGNNEQIPDEQVVSQSISELGGLCELVAESAMEYSAPMKLLERITVEPDKCGGRPCIRGMRIRVTDILGMLAEGVSHDELLRDFPYLEPDDIKAALAYAARQADHAVLQGA
jgi:uncharacterized protein (DUF433 family)